MKALLIILAVSMIASVASSEDTGPRPWTFETGVTLEKVAECDDSGKPSVTARGTPKEYVVEGRADFPCDGKLKKPWVSLPIDGKATLVLDSDRPRLFTSSCDCSQAVVIRIADRLSTADVLYVVNGSVVVGHVVLP